MPRKKQFVKRLFASGMISPLDAEPDAEATPEPGRPENTGPWFQFEVLAWQRLVLFRIMSQHVYAVQTHVCHSNGFKVVISESRFPSVVVSQNVIRVFVRGTEWRSDDMEAVARCSTPAQALQICSAIESALHDWAVLRGGKLAKTRKQTSVVTYHRKS